MKIIILSFSIFLFVSCTGSSESISVISETTESSKQTEQQNPENNQPEEDTNINTTQQVEATNSSNENQDSVNLNNLPDIKEFIKNKSDRFIVDFDDIVAAHPYVGSRSPKPHNDLQVYFSNSDPRWINATKPSDYPPIYAVADGVIQMAQGNGSLYNIVDHSDSDPPWWHSAYLFKLQFAKNNGNIVSFLYQMEGYVIKEDKNFFADYLLVEDGQSVKKGDILGYMYVPTFEELVGSMQGSSHIAFAIMEKIGPQEEQEKVPSMFTSEIINEFSNLARNPREGWNSKSYGNDWSRGRGLPNLIGWMIGAEEHMFGGDYLDAVSYGDERDANLDSDKVIESTKLGFQTDAYIFNSHGKGNAELNMIFSQNEKVDFIVLTNGSPVIMKFIFKQDNGEERESKFMDKRKGQGHQFQYYQSFGFNKNTTLVIEDPEEWGWSVAFVLEGTPALIPGESRDVQPYCPPGCPPSPNPYKLQQGNK